MDRRRSRRVTRHAASAVVLAATLVCMVPSLGRAAEPDPETRKRSALELAQERLQDTLDFATVVAEKVSAAQAQKAQLEAEIAAAEAEIPELRARAEELRRMVRERAVRLYVRSATPKLEQVVNTDNVVDAARAAHLTDTIGDARHGRRLRAPGHGA